jgi:NAD(P)-dependent dehydrogenase (short-subunit alcohol dehydrogenase family)
MSAVRVAMVTGCSSGIGEATAWALAGAGYRVYATARNVADMDRLRKRAEDSKLALLARELDVTRQDSIDDVIEEVEKIEGRLDVLVNNAGYALIGSVEDLPLEDIKRQFDANVFGLVAMYKAAIPLMRETGGGTVVNISSVAGRLSAPLMGAYCSTKFAVEALSLAMNSEVRQFGIRVVVIEPGPVDTRFSENALKASGHVVRRDDSPYSHGYVKLRSMYEEDFSHGVPADRVAKVIMRAVRAKRPRTRYSVRARERLYTTAGALVVTRIGQRFIRYYFGLGARRGKQSAAEPRLLNQEKQN